MYEFVKIINYLKFKIVVMVGILLLCTSCSTQRNNAEIDDNTQKMLIYLGFTECILLKEGKYIDVSYEKVAYDVSEQDIRGNMCDMEDYAEKIPVTERVNVMNGDYIVVDYKIIYNGEILNEMENDIVHIGAGSYDEQFEKNIIGAKLNESYKMDWVVLDIADIYGGYKELVGKTLMIEAVVKEIYGIKQKELSDEFVQKEFGVNSVEEYYKMVNKEVLENKKKAAREEEITNILKMIIEDGEHKLNEYVIVENAANIYEEYGYYANLYNIELEEYAQNFYGADSDQLYDIAYDESCEEVKRYLTIGAIIKEQGFMATEEDINAFCKQYNTEPDKMSDEAKCYMYYNILENKALDFIYENACENQ